MPRTKKKPEPPTAPGPQQLKIALEPGDDTPAFYVNYAEITHTLYEFALYGTQIPSKFSTHLMESMRRGEALTLSPTVQLIFPAAMVPGLIAALNLQYQNYLNLTQAAKVADGK